MIENIDDTPGRQAIVAMKEIHKEIVFKKPVGKPRRRHKQKTLDEDSYVEVSCWVLLILLLFNVSFV